MVFVNCADYNRKHKRGNNKRRGFMKKLTLGLFAIFFLASLTLFADMVNGVEIYKSGCFPAGKTIQTDRLKSIKEGKVDRVLYLTAPLKFRDDGSPNGKGGFTYMAKVNRTWVGGFVTKYTKAEISRAVFKITIPYQSSLGAGDVYNFRNNSPLTIISKKSSLGSDAEDYDVYTCIYQGYLTFKHGAVFPTADSTAEKSSQPSKK
jgi:hypothetical protein